MLTAIIQARMTSTRLPGKVLKEVLGRPLLSYLFERLRRVKEIEQIVLATTTNKEDDPIVELCKKEDILYFRGQEHDVLDRYYQTALLYNADPVMRITSDCPLIDIDVVRSVIEKYKEGEYDYVVTGPRFVEGFDCEIFSFAMLELAWKNAEKKYEREYCTMFLHNHPKLCKKFTLDNISDDSKYRVTVDEPQDFVVVKIILEALYPGNTEFSGSDVKSFLDSHPHVSALNGTIIRNEGLIKSLAEENHQP